MLSDEAAIRRLTARLQEAGGRDVPLLQELLYGLHALIPFGFRKEEELYLPLLERESADRVPHVFGTIGEISSEHRHPAEGEV